MVKQGVEQNGRLNEHPLGELMREATVAGLSGAFRLAQTRVKSVVYFEAGKLVVAVSNIHAHRLSEIALKWNFISQQQLATVSKKLTDAQLGLALVESGVLTTETLSQLFSLQAASVLRPMLLWIEGTWSFDPRVRLVEEIEMQLDMGTLFIESARRLPPDFVAKRFSNTNEMLFVNMTPPMDVALQPAEGFVLSRISPGGIRLHELLSISGLPEVETLASLYALALSGFLDRDRWPRAFTDETLARFKAVDEAVLKTKSETVATTVPAKEKVVSSVAPDAPVAEPEVDKQQEIDTFFFRVECAEDFYEVLAVTRSADATAIKRAYHGLARRFHPDRFHQDAGSPLHARLQATFARVAQAYETLKDSKSRSSYDLRLQAEKRMRAPGSFSTGSSQTMNTGQQHPQSQARVENKNSGPDQSAAPQDAEEVFQNGLLALKAGNMSHAVALLAEAVRREPKEARYRAYYGRSLSGNKQMRHQAEAELKMAISLDENNASYRLMLAELYVEYGMKRRAQGEAQRVLVVDPYNVEALRLLQTLSSGS